MCALLRARRVLQFPAFVAVRACAVRARLFARVFVLVFILLRCWGRFFLPLTAPFSVFRPAGSMLRVCISNSKNNATA